jgi:hypothetical protein
MLHTHRRWRITDVHEPADLAEFLTQRTWTTCTAFRHDGLIFANDAFGPDGAQEYAVVREHDSVQVESWTCSWMTTERCLYLILQLLASDRRTSFETPVAIRHHAPGACGACA